MTKEESSTLGKITEIAIIAEELLFDLQHATYEIQTLLKEISKITSRDSS
jgi:hypothetical protein